MVWKNLGEISVCLPGSPTNGQHRPLTQAIRIFLYHSIVLDGWISHIVQDVRALVIAHDGKFFTFLRPPKTRAIGLGKVKNWISDA